MCNKVDNSCREEKLGCEGCFYKEKGIIDKILNTDFLEDMCSEETANEYKKFIKEELKEIKQKAFEDGQESIVKRYISKDKIIEKLKKDIKSINEKLHSEEHINLYRTYRLKGMKTKCKELLKFLESEENK